MSLLLLFASRAAAVPGAATASPLGWEAAVEWGAAEAEVPVFAGPLVFEPRRRPRIGVPAEAWPQGWAVRAEVGQAFVSGAALALAAGMEARPSFGLAAVSALRRPRAQAVRLEPYRPGRRLRLAGDAAPAGWEAWAAWGGSEGRGGAAAAPSGAEAAAAFGQALVAIGPDRVAAAREAVRAADEEFLLLLLEALDEVA